MKPINVLLSKNTSEYHKCAIPSRKPSPKSHAPPPPATSVCFLLSVLVVP
jgi:hypothetical protein